MNQKHLLRFIKKCMKTHADDVVRISKSNGKPQTLKQVKFCHVLNYEESLA